MTTASNPRLFPWGVYRLEGFSWVLVNRFRNSRDAEDYAKVYKRSIEQEVKVAFEPVK